MAPSLDWVNVMTYDFHSGGNRAGFNSALYNHDDPSNPKLEHARRRAGDPRQGRPALQARRRRAVLRARLARLESAAPWSTGTGTCKSAAIEASPTHSLQSPGFVRHWDDVAKVPWLYNAERRSGLPTRMRNPCASKASTSPSKACRARCSGNCQTTTARCSTRCVPVYPSDTRSPARFKQEKLEKRRVDLWQARKRGNEHRAGVRPKKCSPVSPVSPADLLVRSQRDSERRSISFALTACKCT